MNAAKYDHLVEQQTQLSRKVLAVVPLQDAWRAHMVAAELKRQGQNMDFHIVRGCLRALKEAGLIREIQPDHWVRVTPKAAPAPQAAPIIPAIDDNKNVLSFPEKTMTVQATASTVDRLATIATQARAMADQLRKLAADVEETALEAEAELQRFQGEVQKYRQLKQLLKTADE